MTTFSRSEFPPQGWTYHQPETGWHAPMPMVYSFDRQVQEIIKMRRLNPAMMLRHKWSVDPRVVGDELERYTRLRCGWPMPIPYQPSAMPILPGIGPLTVNTTSDIKRLAMGAGMLMAWNDSTDPAVDSATANARAVTCEACPRNRIDKLDDWLKVPIVSALKKRLARLTNAMDLKTPSDARLGLCEACSVPNAIFVHEPMAWIEKKLKPEYRADLDPNCWITKA